MTDTIHFTLIDEVKDTKHDVVVEYKHGALTLAIEQNLDVYIGVEIWDGALRGLFGEDADVIMNDPGVIVEERFADASD